MTPLALLVADPGHAEPGPCAELAEPNLVLPSARDTRIMQTHRSMNDGAAGLIWLKRGPHVRGIVGFDLSCLDLREIQCAELGVSIYDGYSRGGTAVFSAHHLEVDWTEGNQAFNPMSFSISRDQGGADLHVLGPFPGTGEGTTWNCQTDRSLDASATDECPEAEKWNGGDYCGGEPCYQAVPTDNAYYQDQDQEELWWDVTEDLREQDQSQVSWLLKLLNEQVKSGSVKFFTKDGAIFRAGLDPANADAHMALAPRLNLYGNIRRAPVIELVAPLVAVSASTVDVFVRDSGNPASQPITWEHLGTGETGTMEASSEGIWSTPMDLLLGDNEITFTAIDGCGAVGSETVTIVRWETDNCGNGVVDEFETCDDSNREDGDCCSSACRIEPDGSSCEDGNLCTAKDSCQAGSCQSGAVGPDSCGNISLCYESRDKSQNQAAQRIEFEDVLSKELYDLKKVSSVCVAANVNGQDPVDPDSHYLGYRGILSTSAGSQKPMEAFRVTTSWGTTDVITRGVDRLMVSSALELGGAPDAPDSSTADNYKCHRIRSRGRADHSQSPLHIDEFLENRFYKLRRPSRLCLPATVEGESPINQGHSLLCYDVRRSKGEPRHQRPQELLGATNIFGNHEIATRRESRVCIPARVDQLR